MGNQDKISKIPFGDQELSTHETPSSKTGSYDIAEDCERKNDRKDKRLVLIEKVLLGTAILFLLYWVVTIIFTYCGKGEIADRAANVAFVVTISSIATTALGAVIGSSID